MLYLGTHFRSSGAGLSKYSSRICFLRERGIVRTWRKIIAGAAAYSNHSPAPPGFRAGKSCRRIYKRRCRVPPRRHTLAIRRMAAVNRDFHGVLRLTFSALIGPNEGNPTDCSELT